MTQYLASNTVLHLLSLSECAKFDYNAHIYITHYTSHYTHITSHYTSCPTMRIQSHSIKCTPHLSPYPHRFLCREARRVAPHAAASMQAQPRSIPSSLSLKRLSRTSRKSGSVLKRGRVGGSTGSSSSEAHISQVVSSSNSGGSAEDSLNRSMSSDGQSGSSGSTGSGSESQKGCSGSSNGGRDADKSTVCSVACQTPPYQPKKPIPGMESAVPSLLPLSLLFLLSFLPPSLSPFPSSLPPFLPSSLSPSPPSFSQTPSFFLLFSLHHRSQWH